MSTTEYMNVTELNREQLNELKVAYVCEHSEEPSWDDICDAESVPDEVIFTEYAYISFSPDDFAPDGFWGSAENSPCTT